MSFMYCQIKRKYKDVRDRYIQSYLLAKTKKEKEKLLVPIIATFF